ncbi:MAG: glycosyltransferase [Paludibacteraceae bacterium]|nr:glycosyltransferase [Paludibacteraceae bacterium]MCK9615937.1 glycosyltransferase [Candidatus Omnitrophota bacterium]
MKDKITVFLTAFHRMDNVEVLLQSLSRQTFNDFDIVIINNNINERFRINEMTWESDNQMNIIVVHMDYNSGTIARYLEARQRDCDFAIFLDDDIILRKESIQSFVDSRQKGKAVSCLGYEFGSNLSEKKKVYSGNAKAIGTGMMIFDAEMIRRNDFISEWKPQFYVCDDMWFCRYLQTHGYETVVDKKVKAFLKPSEPSSMIKTGIIQKLKQEFVDSEQW